MQDTGYKIQERWHLARMQKIQAGNPSYDAKSKTANLAELLKDTSRRMQIRKKRRI